VNDPNAAATVNGQQGAMTPEQLKALSTDLLTTLRSDINAAITTRLGGRGGDEELRAQLKSLADTVQSLQSAGNGTPSGAAGNGKTQGDEQLKAQVQELQKALQSTDGQLLKERKSGSIRTALAKSGLRPDAIDDALTLMMSRDDLKPSQDAHGNTIWRGQIKGQLGIMVDADLGDVVKEFVSEKRYMMPPTSAGGSGAPGGEGALAGITKPLDQMTEAEVAALPKETLDALWTEGGGGSGSGGFFS